MIVSNKILQRILRESSNFMISWSSYEKFNLEQFYLITTAEVGGRRGAKRLMVISCVPICFLLSGYSDYSKIAALGEQANLEGGNLSVFTA